MHQHVIQQETSMGIVVHSQNVEI
uniref:Uncharacterized protein n=1 Tax=Arundo donax TaxID=35708 RepID=A0A0A9BYK7_ARUDO